MKRVGIFSGTFDPVHKGHVSFALAAAKEFGLHKVFFLPEPRPRRKQGVRAFEHRAAMVELALQDHENLGLIVLDQARFTPRETLPILQARLKGAKLYMLIGEDMLDHLAGWPDVESLASNITFIVGLRRKTKAEVRQLLDTIHATRGLAITAYVFQEPVSDASSTHARSQLRNGLLPRTVSPAVKNYIKQHRLYRPYKSAAKS